MSESDADFLSDQSLAQIRARADEVDRSGRWPGEDLELLAETGVLRWAVPKESGGLGLCALEQHLGYERIARASLALALILSQRDSAVGLIEGSESAAAKELLPRLTSGETFSTVGIAQLTTSRQVGPPAVRAMRRDEGYQLDGLIPWCTGAAQADVIVAGAVAEDGRQILVLLDPKSPGVKIDEAFRLVALASTQTASIHLQSVRIEQSAVLRGPADKVLIRNNHLALGQAFLALGFCRGTLDLIAEHWSDTGEKAFKRLEAELLSLREQVLQLSEAGVDPDADGAAPLIRGQCNDLALRTAHTAVTLFKGAALLRTHPAQRLAREALFLLVWSCPNPVIDCTVEILTREKS
jgi:alkylation response protein AidB-like acyl-CoA dehydrogenase